MLKTQAVGSALVAEVQYEGCTNYEGRKILVYEKLSDGELLQLRFLDPHFCDSATHKSPVARLEPTQRGWRLAIGLAAKLDSK